MGSRQKLELQVPLSVSSFVEQGSQFLQVWSNHRTEIVAPAIDQPIYHVDRFEDLPANVQDIFSRLSRRRIAMNTATGKKLVTEYLATNEITAKYIKKLVKEAFSNTDEDSRNIVQYLSTNSLKISGMERGFTDYVMIDTPDYYRAWPNGPLKVMVFDIEQLSDGKKFPPAMNPLISISVLTTDEFGVEDNKLFHMQSHKDAQGKVIDKEIIKAFSKILLEYDPDILVGYNCNYYDLPVLITRMRAVGVDPKIFDRTRKNEPYFFKKRASNRDIDECLITGRLVYDVYHSVVQDQTLHGVTKNKRMKTIAKYFQKKGVIPASVEIIEEDMHDNQELVGTDRLRLYNDSDVRITKYMFDMYVKNNIAVAEFIGCPLSKVVPLASSYPFTIVSARVFKQQNMLTFGRNIDKTPWVWDTTSKPYQGADVDCFQTGRFEDVFEYDVSSLYPSIVAAVGLGSDNTTLIGTEPYKEHPTTHMWVEKQGDVRIYKIPDKVRNFNWIIRVNGYSKIAAVISEFLHERMQLKNKSNVLEDYSVALHDNTGNTQQWKETLMQHDLLDCWNNPTQTRSLQSSFYVRAYGLKVILNSMYGLTGDKFNPFGNIAVAVCITGIGRRILANGVEFLHVENCLLEDTDGIKSTLDADIEKMNEWTDGYVQNFLHGQPLIKWEKKKFKTIFVSKQKNYLLLNMKGKLEIHGVSFKSSAMPPLFDSVIREVGLAMLKHGHKNTHKTVGKYYNLTTLDQREFVKTIKVSKRIAGKKVNDKWELDMSGTEYTSGNSLTCQVALSYMREYNMVPSKGMELEYVKTLNGYEAATPDNLKKLDVPYYRSVVDDAVKRLGYKAGINFTLDAFL